MMSPFTRDTTLYPGTSSVQKTSLRLIISSADYRFYGVFPPPLLAIASMTELTEKQLYTVLFSLLHAWGKVQGRGVRKE
jgi:hypothetical protein